jgi:hypothetical protein
MTCPQHHRRQHCADIAEVPRHHHSHWNHPLDNMISWDALPTSQPNETAAVARPARPPKAVLKAWWSSLYVDPTANDVRDIGRYLRVVSRGGMSPHLGQPLASPIVHSAGAPAATGVWPDCIISIRMARRFWPLKSNSGSQTSIPLIK